MQNKTKNKTKTNANTQNRFAHMKTIKREVFKEARKSELLGSGLSVDCVAGIIAARQATACREAAVEAEYKAVRDGGKSEAGYWYVRANMLARIAKQNGAGYLLRSNREGVLHDDRPR